MHQNHIPAHSMSSSHPCTAVNDDDDDTDICPVCDGQCTCRIQSLSMAPKYQPPPPTPSLKIKFTLPPNLIAKRTIHNKSSTNNQQTISASVTDAYTSTPPKKRGRPPKHPLPPPQKTPAKITKIRHNLKARTAISKKIIKRKRVAIRSDQELSSSDTTDQPRRLYQHDQPKFPTFLSASALSSISSTSDSSPSSSTSDYDEDADSDIQAEEENFIVADIHTKARLRKELLGGDDPHLKKRSHNSDWVIRPRKRSVGGSDLEEMDVDTDPTDDEPQNEQPGNENDDDDDDDGEDEEPDGMNEVEEDDDDTDGRHHYVGLATGWSEEDESSFDADLFFANLSDSSSSSASSSTSTHRRRCHSYTPGGIDADQSSSTSESHLSTRATLESLPFEVTENWDGHLIFTNGLAGEAESRAIVDIDFEKDAERFIIDSDADDDDDDDDGYSSSSNSSFHGLYQNYDHPVPVPESSDVDMFSISDADAGYEEEDGEANEGDTTDEELVGDDFLPNERAMKLFTFPMSTPISMGIGVSAINPMSTVSPTIEKRRHRRVVDGDREERKTWRRRLRLGVGLKESPRAADILAGKTAFWSTRYASSSSSSNSIVKGKGKQKASAPFSPSSSAFSSPPCPTRTPCTPRTGLFVPTGETRQAVIKDDRKGVDVPSPHPRFSGRKRMSRVSVVQYLLKKHLQQQSQSSIVPPPPTTNKNSGSSPSINSDAPSPFHHLLSSSAASPPTGTDDLSTTSTAAGDEYDRGSSIPCHCPVEAKADDDDDKSTCIVKLDDVLEASFLDDAMDRECEASAGASSIPTSRTHSSLLEDSSAVPTTTTSPPDSTAASNKHLARWDVISIGAFRQTREQQQQAWGPVSRSSSSAVGDYGGAIKSGAGVGSPLSALLWQNSGSTGVSAAGSRKKPSSSMPTTPSALASRSSTKAAKRRRLMMTSSTMSSPLVLPLSSPSLTTIPPSKSHSHSHSRSHSHSQPCSSSPTTYKNRKELRREKRRLKKKSSSGSQTYPQQQLASSSHHHHPPPHSYAVHPNNASHHHHFHTHHQHHPNLKTRGTSSSQRMGFFGAVPPLNL